MVRKRIQSGLWILALALGISLGFANETALARGIPEDVILVSPESPCAMSCDGRTWNTAFRLLEDALAEAEGNDSIRAIWVVQGTYNPAGSSDETFKMVRDVRVLGGFLHGQTNEDDRLANPELTTLTGNLGALAGRSNAAHVVTFLSETSPQTEIDGFTITGGVATMGGVGGGVLCESNSAGTIRNCLITGNESDDFGGGVFLDTGSGVKIRDSHITHNTSRFGGGVTITSSSGAILHSFIEHNTAVVNGGGIAITISGSSTVVSCQVRHNTAGVDGGGI